MANPVHCSFCGCSSDDVSVVIGNAPNYICFECVIDAGKAAKAYFAGEMEYKSWSWIEAKDAA